MKNIIKILSCFLIMLIYCPWLHADKEEAELNKSVLEAINQGIAFFYSTNTHGGYVFFVTTDLKIRWGESRQDEHTIEVQPPGTPVVGMTFLRASRITGNSDYLKAARDAAFALIRGQNNLGGWEHTINFRQPESQEVSFDDDQTQSAIRFLMALDQDIDDDSLSMSIEKSLQLLLDSQLDNGGWPHRYPARGDYHDYATFNDQGINDCIRTMMDAARFYGKSEYKECLNKAGRFMVISQLPPPQPGWAQQYNEFLQPAWARDFEPPAVCPAVTVNNLFTLMDLYLLTNNNVYLKPIPDAILWLENIRLPNGKWARFVELGTGKSLYYDRDRVRVESVNDLHIERRTGYGYESNLLERLQQAKERFRHIRDKSGAYGPLSNQKQKLRKIIPKVKEIIATQDKSGRWVTKNDRFRKYTPGVRWNGEYDVRDRISSAVFIHNIKP